MDVMGPQTISTRSNLWALALAAALAGCVGDLPDDGADSPDAAALEPLAAGSLKQLVRKGSGKCLDVDGAGTSNGTNIHQWTCNGTTAQAFALDDLGGGFYRLTNPSSGKCVDVSANSNANGANVQLWTCNGSGAQKFKMEDVGDGHVRFKKSGTSKCIDVNAGSNADGANVQLWSCNSGSSQRWTVEDFIEEDEDGDGDDDDGDDDDDNLIWKTANLTNFTSYPDPGSDECINYNGCMWAGYFAFVEDQQPESWVMSHNIAAVHSDDASTYALKTLRLRQGGREIDVTVYDMCSDSDCSGCCTANSSDTGFLIDIESYTMERFGSGDGIVEWACLDC
jgi:hypothetical protein